MFDKILDSKKCFLDNKNINFKKVEKLHCIKGLSPRFWSKFWKFILSFYFIQNRQGKCVWQYPSWKKETLHTIKKSILKTRKTEFFQRGVSMVLVKKLKFLCFYFGQKSKENVSKKFFIAKKGFPGNDNINFKKSKNCNFPKGLVHGFG